MVLATSYLDEAERAFDVLALGAGRELAAGTPQQIVASMPGTLRVSDTRPGGEAGRRAWRRGGRWRIRDPAGQPGEPGTEAAGKLVPDLQDAVTVAILARELASGTPAPDGDGPRGGGGDR